MIRTAPLTILAARAVALASLAQPLALLLTRLVFGWSFHETGLGKLRNLEGTTEFFAGLGIPAPAVQAAFVSSLEAAGGIALVLGFATRPVAGLLASTMVVALATADRESFLKALSGDATLTDVVPLVYLLALLVLLGFGAGALSLDRIVQGLFGKKGRAASAAPATAALSVKPVSVQ
jgi:putative oxidoreductase